MEKLRRLLNSRQPQLQNLKGFFVSAVLLPLIEINGEPQILFEVRSINLKRQPGEICFPGGMMERYETGRPQETAIRETKEELGLSGEPIDLIGPLDCFVSPLGALIYPFLGKISAATKILPNPNEVQEVFYVPVRYLLSANPTQSSVDLGTRYADNFPFDKLPVYYQTGWRALGTLPVYFYEYEGRLIWGATANILHNFIAFYRECIGTE